MTEEAEKPVKTSGSESLAALGSAPLPPGRKRRSPCWRKLIVDGLKVSVYPMSRETAKERRMAHLSGVRLERATREERQDFLEKHPMARGV